ncbi:glucose 1-dehydrogenase [Chloroflexota bacterium]
MAGERKANIAERHPVFAFCSPAKLLRSFHPTHGISQAPARKGESSMEFSLEGKIALITGGSRGIGRATALGFARAGADVAIASRKLPDLEKVAGEIKGMGRRSLAVAAHLGRMEDINNLVTRVKEEFGRIDILVNNAASNPTMASALEVDERAWDTIINLNAKGLFFLSQAAARVMKEQGGGCIINIASAAGIRPHMLPVYSISKAAVIMATRVMALEWAQYGIRVNAVAPGLTRTRFSRALWDDEQVSKQLLNRIAMKRPGEPEEIAGAMIYLASDAASFVTGALLSVDGGEAI